MKVQIVGVGVVGSAQAYLAHSLGHEVLGFDHGRHSSEHARMVTELATDVDVTFVCTPELAVPGAVADLVARNVGGLHVIKSTVPSGTTRRLMDQYSRHFCHNPEFLREKSALYDVVHPDAIVVGQCCPEHGAILKEFYQPLGCPIVVAPPTITETAKLTLNSYLATLITFWKELMASPVLWG